MASRSKKSAATQQLESETRAMEIRLRGLKEERDKLLVKMQSVSVCVVFIQIHEVIKLKRRYFFHVSDS